MGARQVLGGFSNSDLSSLFHMHKKIEMELQCPACLDLLNIPTLLPCDHICCKKCISYLMEDGYCTACRLPFNGRKEELRVIYSIQNMVEQFNIMSAIFAAKPLQILDVPTSQTTDIQSLKYRDPEGTASLVAALDAMESPIPSPAGEGSSRRRLESTTIVAESLLDPNTRAEVGELLEPTPEKSAISSQKSAIPVVALEVPTTAAESLVEAGEIREPAMGESAISSGKSPIAEVAMDVPTTQLQTLFKRRSRRDSDPGLTIISYKSVIPDPESAIQAEQSEIPLRVVEPNPDSLIVNVEGVITSGLNANKCKHADDSKRSKKKRKSRKHRERRDEPESSHPRHRMGKVRILNDDDVVYNPHNLDYEQELIIERGEIRTAGGGHAHNPLDGAQTPPPVTELDRDRYRMAEFPFYQGTENPTGFAFCETWVNSVPRLLPVSPTTEGSIEQVRTNPPALPQSGDFHPPSSLDMFQTRDLLRKTRISGYLRFWCFRSQPANLPPPGFQAIHGMYFRHFSELPVPTLMSQILLATEVSLSQFQAAFYIYIRGFSNIPPSANLFFWYFKLNKASNAESGRIGVSRRFHDRNLIDKIPSNYGNWQKNFIFIHSDFIPGSREQWVDANMVSLDASHPLTAKELEYVDKITKKFVEYNLDRGVPYVLCQREDFDFSDLKAFRGFTAEKKKRMHQFVDALPPHLVIRMRHAKLIELRKVEDSQPRRSTFEKDLSSRAPNTQQTRPGPPKFFPFKSAFNYPSLYANPEGSYVTQACLGMQSQNDTLHVQEEYNELLGKYKTLRLQAQSLKRKSKELDNLRSNVIPRMQREASLKDKEISEKDNEILKLRKELEAKTTAETGLQTQIESLKTRLDLEIGSVVAYNSNIQKLESQLSQTKLSASASEEQLKKATENLEASSEKIKDLEFELGDQADQLQELGYFGPSVFPALPAVFMNNIMDWIERNPQEIAKHKKVLDELKRKNRESKD